jgi:hypothetical protein
VPWLLHTARGAYMPGERCGGLACRIVPASCDGEGLPAVNRERPFSNLCICWTNMLSLCSKQCLNGLHDQSLPITKTIVSHLFCIGNECLGLERGITAFAVVVAAQPDRDILRICNLVAGVLLTRDLCTSKVTWVRAAGAAATTNINPNRTTAILGMFFSPKIICRIGMPIHAVVFRS